MFFKFTLIAFFLSASENCVFTQFSKIRAYIYVHIKVTLKLCSCSINKSAVHAANDTKAENEGSSSAEFTKLKKKHNKKQIFFWLFSKYGNFIIVESELNLSFVYLD